MKEPDRVERAQIGGFGDAAFGARIERTFQRLDAGEAVDDEIRVLAELVPLAEIFRPVVGEFQPGNAGDEDDGEDGGAPEQNAAASRG